MKQDIEPSETRGIDNRADLVEFLELLSKQIQSGEIRVENQDVGQFVEAMSAWLADADGYYQATEGQDCPVAPHWKTFADLVMAGTIYE